MLNRKNLFKLLKNPSLLVVVFRRWFPRRAQRLDAECRHLISAWSSGSLPRVRITELFPGIDSVDVVLRKPENRIVGWSLDLQELVHLVAIAKQTGARRVLEIGTFDGFTALNLAANMDPDARVSTLDLPQAQNQSDLRAGGISNAVISNKIGSKFLSEPEAGRIRQIFGNSGVDDWNGFGGPFDLILIDGSHDYEYVKSDGLNAIKVARPGATILWHDYGQAVDVARAVDELARRYPIRAILGTRFACLRLPPTTN
jgi:predicted O-methyltransferase YrrM